MPRFKKFTNELVRSFCPGLEFDPGLWGCISPVFEIKMVVEYGTYRNKILKIR